jgi:hypothetical protein
MLGHVVLAGIVLTSIVVVGMVLIDVLLERRELHIEVGLQLIKPGLHGDHRRWPQPEVPQPRVARGPLVDDDPGL